MLEYFSILFPPAGVSFETSSSALIDQIPVALGVFADAVENFLEIPANQVKRFSFPAPLYKTSQNLPLSPTLSCMDGGSAYVETRWSLGDEFYK